MSVFYGSVQDELIRIKEQTPGVVDNAISVIQPAGMSTYDIILCGK